jgi:uncharacterized membrane protein
MSNPVVRLLGTLIVCAAFSLPMIIIAQSAALSGFGLGQILTILGLGVFMVGGLAFIWISEESQLSAGATASKRKNEGQQRTPLQDMLRRIEEKNTQKLRNKEHIVRLLEELSGDELDALRTRLDSGKNYALDDDGELVRKKLRR